MAIEITEPMSKSLRAVEERPLIKTPQELVHIKHKISLRQYKYWLLMLRAYREAYELDTIPNDQGYYQLPIATFEKWLGYELVRGELKADLESIRREPIIYNVLGKDGKKILRGAGFISEWELTANWVGFKLPGFLMESIQQLDLKNSIFQKINWEVFNSFTGKYEAILYKLCRDYIGSRRTPTMTIQAYREYMGLKESEYAEFKNLNRFVIAAPVKQINESQLSDIIVEVVFTREKRQTATVQFLVTPKLQTAMNFGDDDAFSLAKVSIALTQQKEYLTSKEPKMIELSIQRANEYGEEQEKLGKEVNFGALYRKAIEEDWGKEYQSKKAREAEKVAVITQEKTTEAVENKKNKLSELKEDFRRLQVTKALKSISFERKRVLATKYVAEVGQGRASSYDPVRVEFNDKTETTYFSIWLRKEVIPEFDEAAFASWLKNEKGIDLPKQPHQG
jgi:Initiator Replication protein